MEAEIKHVEAVEKAVSPTIKFNVELEIKQGKEIPLTATGALYYPSDVFLAPLFELPDENNYPEIYLRSSPRPSSAYDPNRVWLHFGAALGSRELDHIESVREKTPKGDVQLTLKLTIRYALLSADAWALTEMRTTNNGPTSVIVAPPTADGRAVLVENATAGFLLQKATTFHKGHRIPGNDWVHEFAPRLGIGRFAIFEIPEPSIFPGELGERMGKALAAASKAENSLRAGEWTDVCEDLRGVWESLRDYTFVHDVLVKDGFSNDAATLLNTALRSLFDLASKFGHTLDRDKKTVLPELTAKKEDAYLLYSSARSVLNLIARKAKRVGRP